MKLYHNAFAPNAARVRFFAAELEQALDLVDVDLLKLEQRSSSYLAKVPSGLVPALELDNGDCISESKAICLYLASISNNRRLLGDTELRQAEIEMWDRRIEFELYLPIAHTVRHTVAYMAAMGPQIPDWGASQRDAAERRLQTLNMELADKAYIAGDEFSVADITAYCAIRFFRAAKGSISAEQHPHLWDWFSRVKARPAASAC